MANQKVIRAALWKMTTSEPEKFSEFFQRLRKEFPQEVAHACLSFIAEKGLNAVGQKMAYWLMIGSKDLRILLDPDAISADLAKRAVAGLNKWSPEFLVRFVKEAEQLSDPEQLMRVLALVPALGDYGVLLFWLRKLSQHQDQRLKSRAVKLMCGVRPGKEQVERQMTDSNPRVRANALESLWYAKIPEAVRILTSALADTDNRVVGNALVGLHLHGNPSAMEKIRQLCESPHAAVRTTMAWCLGFIQNDQSIPLLQALSRDPSEPVRNWALRGLQMIVPEETMAADANLSPQELAGESLVKQNQPRPVSAPAEIVAVGDLAAVS